MPPQKHIVELSVIVEFIETDGSVNRTECFDLANDQDRKDMGRACSDWYVITGRRIHSEVLKIRKSS